MKPALTAKRRLKLLQRVFKEGESVASACRESGVSRFTFYKWAKKYNAKASRNKNLINLRDKKGKIKRFAKQVTSDVEDEIKKVAGKSPELSKYKIAQKLKQKLGDKAPGIHGVYNVLKRAALNTRLLRTKWQELVLQARGRKLTPEQRYELIRRAEELGISVTQVCRDFGISRYTFYKWKKRWEKEGRRFDALYDRKPKFDRRHLRVKLEHEKEILSLVIEAPSLSKYRIAERIAEKVGPVVSPHGVYNVLLRLGLNRPEARLAYATTRALEIPVPVTWIDRVRYVFEQFIPSLAPAPPPLLITSFRFVKVLIISTILSSATFYSLLWWVNYLTLQVGKTAIGLVLASVALFMGTIFFLYSLKYYLTLAIVLSFSQKGGENGYTNGNGNGNGAKRNLISWILGLTKNGNGNGPERSRRATGPVGLEPDLAHVSLKKHPFISIHIPLYNEKSVVERALKAVSNFDYPGEYEVIMADDSTDGTTQIIGNYLKSTNSKLQITNGERYTLTQAEVRPGVVFKHLHRTTRSGFKGGALQLALKCTDPKAEFISVFDADFVPYPDTLELFLKYFKVQNDMSEDYKKTNVAAVQGYQWHVLNKSENWITRGVRSEYAGNYVIERSGGEIYQGLKQISGAVYMIRRDVLEEVGWETSITEDFQLTLKLYEKGYKVVYTPYIQAPAECVSTLKHLIRQRSRWAEGHSNNIRRMFGRLMFSHNLTSAEKLEFLYLSPYYLQAFFFLVGTIAWLASETLFPARLPFWTSLWGWSLVLTNLLSLPLVNSAGLFLEEAEEKDYAGIASFVALSYILVPFQAYASLKGFLQKEEGPWFRTPKTGRITDIFTRGRFYRLIAGILPGRSASSVQGLASSFNQLNAKRYSLNAYLSLATANSRFNSFNIRPKSLGARWVGKVLVTFFLIISTTMLYFSPSIPSYPDEVIDNGTDFRWDQTPSLILDLKSPKSLKQTILPMIKKVYAKEGEVALPVEQEVFTKVYYDGQERNNIPVEIREFSDGKLEATLMSNENLKPGKYRVEAKTQKDGKDISVSQDFTWGVLAINTDKSIYLPGDKVKLTFAVLDDSGHMVCDAFLRLKIITPEGKPIYLSTEDGTIKVNPECSRKAYTQIPDYEAEYRLGEAGTYEMELSALTENGPRAIKDSFEVRQAVPFDIQRQAPTRIYPLASYPVNFKIQANQDFRGEVIESIPESFEIEERSAFSVERLEDIKQLVWNVDWKEGETYELSYEFNAPIISPEFYLLGPLELADSDKRLAFREARFWQVASDSTQPSVQSVTGQTAGAVNQVVVNSVPGGTDQLYIAIGHFYTSNPAVGNNMISSISGGGLTWAIVTGTRGCSDRIAELRTEWWWAFGSPSTFNATVDLTATTLAAGAHMAFVRISGAANQEPINGEYANTAGDNAACDATGTDNSSPTIGLTISNSTSLALNSAFPRNQSDGVTTPDANYTEDYEVLNISGGNASTIWAGHRTTSPAIGTETITHSLGSTRPWVMAAAEIVVPEYSLIWLGLAPFLPGIIGRLRQKRKNRH